MAWFQLQCMEVRFDKVENIESITLFLYIEWRQTIGASNAGGE